MAAPIARLEENGCLFSREGIIASSHFLPQKMLWEGWAFAHLTHEYDFFSQITAEIPPCCQMHK